MNDPEWYRGIIVLYIIVEIGALVEKQMLGTKKMFGRWFKWNANGGGIDGKTPTTLPLRLMLTTSWPKYMLLLMEPVNHRR
jgi:hypothetical protein